MLFFENFDLDVNDTLPFYISYTPKRRNRTTIVAVKTTTKKQQQIETVIGICQEPFRVVTIMPLQSLQRESREQERVLGRRVQLS